MTNPVITPQTKVGDLLEAHAEAEAALIAIAPQFKALKNPVLRRTVAKVATLEQAARVAGIPVNDLVMSLRKALGIEGPELGSDDTGLAGEGREPDWVANPAKLVVDADSILGAGETPIAKVTTALRELDSGDVIEIDAPFQPAPLIDALRAKGHEVYARPGDGERWKVWVRRS